MREKRTREKREVRTALLVGRLCDDKGEMVGRGVFVVAEIVQS